MEKRRRVLVYGNTLSMAGIAASLKGEPGLEIIIVDPKDPTAQQNLKAFDPETIIFDRSDQHSILDLALLREQSGLLLIGVDPSSDEALVLSGKLSRVLTIKELAKLVSAQVVQLTTEDEGKKEDGESGL